MLRFLSPVSQNKLSLKKGGNFDTSGNPIDSINNSVILLYHFFMLKYFVA